jgi:hypothetical protein
VPLIFLKVGWPAPGFQPDFSGFRVKKNSIELKGESFAGCIELLKNRRFLALPFYNLVTLLEFIIKAS